VSIHIQRRYIIFYANDFQVTDVTRRNQKWSLLIIVVIAVIILAFQNNVGTIYNLPNIYRGKLTHTQTHVTARNCHIMVTSRCTRPRPSIRVTR
jgi:hypothetical protein